MTAADQPKAFAYGGVLIQHATRFSTSVRVASAASAIVVTIVGSKRGNINCGQRAVDTKPLRLAGGITASASSPTGTGDISPW
jgi:hypothetical protein